MIKFWYDLTVRFRSSLYSCSHRSTVTTLGAVLYCLMLATAYVASLYVVVPRRIRRKFDRDHPKHVQWRCWSCLVVCLLAVSTYPMFFCIAAAKTGMDALAEDDEETVSARNSSKSDDKTFSVETIMFRPRYVGSVLIHTMILYTGPIVANLLRVYEIRRLRRISTAAAAAPTTTENVVKKKPPKPSPQKKVNSADDDDDNDDSDSDYNDDDYINDETNNEDDDNINPAVVITTTTTSYIMDVVHILLSPTIQSFITPESEAELWINIRNFVLAPLTEEIVFRGCMIPPLVVALSSASSSSTSSIAFRVSLIAPLFFGVAHIHHAVVRLQKASSSSASSFRPSVSSVILMTTFQFIYTTLFGAYATYILIRTGSVLAVTVSHSYCNLMGLPDLSFFLHPNHPMYRYRVTILTSYLIGVFTFKHFLLCSTDETCWGSKSLLPLPSELFSMLSIQ